MAFILVQIFRVRVVVIHMLPFQCYLSVRIWQKSQACVGLNLWRGVHIVAVYINVIGDFIMLIGMTGIGTGKGQLPLLSQRVVK